MTSRAHLASILALSVVSCSEQPAGEPVVRAELGEASGRSTPAPPASPAATPAAQSVCRDVVFEDVPLTHCIADPAQHRITMVNAPESGPPYGSLANFAATADAKTIAFAMNGGIYGDDLKPVGYYVEDGKRLSLLDRGSGEGNFYMVPNGVFFGSGGSWQVLSSDTFFGTVGERPRFGTQSGPMLLIEGKLHPDIQDDGPSKAVRNGVGVDAAGRAHFVISGGPISFGHFARYFRDVLKLANALHLDSQVSSLWDPASGRQDKGRVGPIIVVTKREGAAE